MKPGFALSLSSTGVGLLQRAAGGWRQIGTVSLDVDDLSAALADLRQLGERHAQGPIACKLIIPNDQIRYLTLETGATDPDSRRAAAEQGLDGATPYQVDELAFDLSEDGAQTHVAAVARETLQEAEDFALMHGFLPVSFVAMPQDMNFLGEPFFGASKTLLESGEAPVEPDGIAVVDIGPADPPPAIADADVDAETDADTRVEENASPNAPLSDDTVAAPPAPSTPEDVSVDDNSVDEIGTNEANAKPIEETLADPDPVPEDPPVADGEDTPPPAIAASGFSTRRRKGGELRAQKAPVPMASAEPPKAPAATKAGAETRTAAPDIDPKPKDGQRVVPHAAFGSIALADSPAATREGDTKVRPLSAPTDGPEAPSSAAKGGIPAAPKASGPAPVLPRDDIADISLPEAPKDKKSLHEAGKASLLAGVSKQKVGGKPRFLGLALVSGLLIFMAIVAAWAILADRQSRNAVSDATTAPLDSPDTSGPGDIAPQVSAIPDQPDEGPLLPLDATPDGTSPSDAAAASDDTEELSSTDTAVLDALRLEQDNAPTADKTLTEDLDRAELAPEADEAGAAADQDTPLTRAAQYAATGIWQHAPETPETPGTDTLETLYVASIDPTDISEDATALPDQTLFATDLELGAISTPTAAGQQFDLDERGLVKATPNGTLNPDGIMVFLGRPEKIPPPTPARPDPEVAAAAEEAARQAILSELRPKQRPNDLVEQNERARLGGLSRAELGALRPRSRPPGLKPPEENSLPATAQAIARSVVPRGRPANFANLVDRAKRNRQRNAEPSISEAVASAPPRTVTPRIPSSASVARQATVDNAINLRRVNLIGVYGTPSNRRALILMPNGRYKKVKVGDRIDGGRVVAIGNSQLQYQKGNRNLTLKIPSS
ncbi:hypothetical protein [Phaeobacter gallaeciensis]|uniref:Type IV pilus biogenesis n=1 Tax=Phaeobacter gallaeciensis TaxID=60890 RepID=A0AAD0EDN8_9RHOB|nr:hypothetical protein [Phaeobacter gallaeciensis]AHD10462.1 hypothetical protein Gal_02729 [Phaeobacter gallaeciensis DSM 26640]ATE93725.1 Type IV pilus biogenesis [Phaeobacter gallaeciensis]ATE96454.1 Type IV pilus biogenesis [Phaeobacter gallaeciensis]ATF02389.1 Type IV pilus biogenesis [Phaeobacter gallaeciensis]ATF06769.1 Type IV pilus biogenesis [Phaeobacter gallaeciensis]